MKDKKNLDRLFQEQFKDFEEIPPEIVWKNIEAELTKKKKRRIIPLWYKLSGVAALFIFGFLGTRALLNQSKIETTNPIVIEEKINSTDNQNSVVDSDEKDNHNQLNSDENDSNKINNNSEKPLFSDDEALANENSNIEKPSKKENNQHNNTDKLNQKKKENSGLVSNSFDKTNRTKEETKNNLNKTNNSELVDNSTTKDKKTKQISETESAIANTGSINQKATGNETENEEKNKLGVLVDNNIIKNDKQFVLEDHSSKIDKNKIDSTAVATLIATNEELNTLGELLKEKEKDQKPKVEPKENKWQITSNLAPVYLGSSSNGSPIDSQFANNSKDYQNTMSYGLGVNYDVSKKLTLRTGINKVNFEYLTNGIEFFASLEGRQMASLSTTNSSNAATIVVQNSTFTTGELSMAWTQQGAIEQSMEYYEIPLELSYKVLNKKFGIDVIGGFSTLLLNDNNLMVVSDGFSAELGKANNLNSVHFSTNVGLGFRYRFWKSFQANFEPTFKYQLNTFSSNDGGFKPYFVGLYSGLSYRF
ncbi:hypothetical protein M0M57_06205 [Flavobacterium azooxidireducens]|uniref:Outer membrane protein beta-barrel domain-containing protein n=1 Tax=Flavobacterium azooxidireducens TaxID=1871076 RepID=A0ABY4KJF1_9FLAO|nr:hypothetical protein [Flavobacterium azooxidireducens]UPQ80426.1 hypothetical protein M0M57_06205 [Flavobacterium azooxidireducens]